MTCPEVCDDCINCFDYENDQLCWPETQGGTYSEVPCPRSPYTDETVELRKFCRQDGGWDESDWFPCLTILTGNSTEGPYTFEQMEFYMKVITGGRIMSLVGCVVSWFSLLVALMIFASFRSLRCSRTKIHVHLFIAMLARISTDLIYRISYLLQYGTLYRLPGVQEMPYLCEFLHVISSYFTLCAFGWMFVEGMYLNTLISSAVFGKPNFIRYYIIAWGFPVLCVTPWTVAMALTSSQCWPLHTDSIFYLIFIEIPRDIIFILNSGFLLHIIYVLVTKLKNNNSGETQVIRKAVKALAVLLPLLGITQLLWRLPMPEPNSSQAVIVIYNYGVLFLYSFQGFAIALLFCFLNKEVRGLIKRKWRIFRDSPVNRRTSVITSTSDVNGSILKEWKGHVPPAPDVLRPMNSQISTRSHRGNGRPGSTTFDSLHRPGSVETLT